MTPQQIEAMKLALDLATMHHTDDGYAELRAKVRSATKEVLAEHAMRETQRLGQEIEQQRTWANLSDEEIKILWIQYRAALPRYLCFAKALLARAKEENT